MIDKTPGTQKPMVAIMGKAWGFRWHLDAGASYDVTPQTSIELLGRYSQTAGLKMKAVALDENLARQTVDYKLKNTSTSIMVGVRQKF
jgi:opacity protein-like surface antigen